MITRNVARQIQDYVEAVRQEDYTLPDGSAIRGISELINSSAKKAFEENATYLQACTQVQRGVQKLREAPRLCGGFHRKNALFGELTPQEQMVVLNQWIQDTNPRKMSTFTFAHSDEVVPVWVRPPPKSRTDAYNVFLGNTRGSLKGPSYVNWQQDDPQGTAQEVFIEPLDALENVRIKGDGALVLKKGAYEAGCIVSDWRYAVKEADGSDAKEASVELPRQKTPKAALARGYASGYNLCEFVASELREQNIIPQRLYEDFHEEGYQDEAVPTATPLQILQSLEPAIQGNFIPLDQLIEKISATHLGFSQIPVVREYTARKLFD